MASRLEQISVAAGTGIAALLGVLSGLGLFAPLGCPRQGVAGLLGAAVLLLLTGPLAMRASGEYGSRRLLAHIGLGLLTVLAAWPVFHTVVLLARSPSG